MALKDIVSAAEAASNDAKAVYDKALTDLSAAQAKLAAVAPHLQALDNIASAISNLPSQLDASAMAVFGGVQTSVLSLVTQVRNYLDS